MDATTTTMTMTMTMTTSTSRTPRAAAALLLCGAALLPCATAWAGEGYRERRTGAPVYHRGYSPYDAARINGVTEIAFDFNKAVWLYGQKPEWTTIGETSPEMRSFVQAMNVGMSLWENAPHARVRFRAGKYRNVKNPFVKDGRNLATLAGGSYPRGGEGGGHLETYLGFPHLVEQDLILHRGWLPVDATEAARLTVHEIGHGLGFNHSLLAGGLVVGIGGAPSAGAFMSYGWNAGTAAALEQGTLTPDDLALLAELYPDHRDRLARSCGTVRGEVIRPQTFAPLFGANVVLMDRATGRPVVHGLSGHDFPSSRRGEFAIYGVPPGTYDLIVAPWNDLATGGPWIQYMQLDANGATSFPVAHADFESGFPRAFVRSVTVAAGQVVDVGWVVAGADRSFAAPSLVDVALTIPTGAAYAYYQVEFWTPSDAGPPKLVRSSGWIQGNTYRTRLPGGRYATRIYGRKPAPAAAEPVLLQSLALRDCVAREKTMAWARRYEGQLEVAQYFFDLHRIDGKADFLQNVAVDGSSLKTMLVPGTYRFRVRASRALGQAPTIVVQDWTNVSVN